ncbi:MAG: allose kinase [Eubacteriales bacterium]|nr:allose kinase [Eubacteriales bacterium]
MNNSFNQSVVIGLDVGGTNIRIGTQAFGQKLTFFEKTARADVLISPDVGLCLAIFIQNYINRHQLAHQTVAIAIGFPSTLSADRRTILQTPNILDMDNIPMADILESNLNIPVFLERDVNLIFDWDSQSRQLDMIGACVGIYFGTGIGNAIFIDGLPLVGYDGCAGEIGHIPRAGSTEICGCGNLGCAECYASGRRLTTINQQYFPQTEIQAIFTLHRESPVIIDYVDEIACVIATEVNILNPGFVIIGGGVLTMQDFPKDLLDERIRFHCRKPFPSQNLQIFYSAESVQAGVLGAVSMAWRKYTTLTEAKPC